MEQINTVAQIIENPTKNVEYLLEQLIQDGALTMPSVEDLEVVSYQEDSFQIGKSKEIKYWHKLKARSISQYETLKSMSLGDKATLYTINLPLTDEPLIGTPEKFETNFKGQMFLEGKELELQYKAKTSKFGALNAIEFKFKD